MKTDKKQQRKEAIDRLKLLKVHSNVIKDFRNDRLNKSERYGILYWLSGEEQNLVNKFEEKHNCTVYHVVKNKTEFGTLLAFLFVNEDDEEWGRDRLDLIDKDENRFLRIFNWTENADDPSSSEFGYSMFHTMIGGLMREF